MADMRHLARWEIDEIVQHMNEDHADSLLLYARHYCGCADALSASLLDVSGQSCSMSVNCQSGSRTVVFELKRSVTNIKQAEMVEPSWAELLSKSLLSTNNCAMRRLLERLGSLSGCCRLIKQKIFQMRLLLKTRSQLPTFL